MAPTVHDTIRLDVDITGILPDNEYGVLADGLEHVYEPAMSIERSLTGKMHIHKVLDSGDPLVFENESLVLLLRRTDSADELAQLVDDLGKVCYFMPHYRDETDVAYRRVVLFSGIQGVEPLDPMTEWFRIAITLESADGNTP